MNLAARIQQLAKPGQVLLSGESYELVKDLYPGAAPSNHQLKGFTEPVTVYDLTYKKAA